MVKTFANDEERKTYYREIKRQQRLRAKGSATPPDNTEKKETPEEIRRQFLRYAQLVIKLIDDDWGDMQAEKTDVLQKIIERSALLGGSSSDADTEDSDVPQYIPISDVSDSDSDDEVDFRKFADMRLK